MKKNYQISLSDLIKEVNVCNYILHVKASTQALWDCVPFTAHWNHFCLLTNILFVFIKDLKKHHLFLWKEKNDTEWSWELHETDLYAKENFLIHLFPQTVTWTAMESFKICPCNMQPANLFHWQWPLPLAQGLLQGRKSPCTKDGNPGVTFCKKKKKSNYNKLYDSSYSGINLFGSSSWYSQTISVQRYDYKIIVNSKDSDCNLLRKYTSPLDATLA